MLPFPVCSLMISLSHKSNNVCGIFFELACNEFVGELSELNRFTEARVTMIETKPPSASIVWMTSFNGTPKENRLNEGWNITEN